MKQYKQNEAPADILYEDPADKYLMFPKALYDVFFKQKNSGDLIAVYSFYCYTSKWQKTNCPKATNGYCMKGLSFGEVRFQRAKNTLIELGLIENIKKGNKGGWYIQINHIAKKATITKELGKQSSYISKNLENKELGKQSTNTLSNNSLNTLSYNNKKNKQKKDLEIKQPLKRTKTLINYFPKDWIDNKNFQTSIKEFITHRKTIKKELTQLACTKIANKWTQFTIKEVCEAIDTAIMNNYTGVFPKKEYTNNNQKGKGLGTHEWTDDRIDYSGVKVHKYDPTKQ